MPRARARALVPPLVRLALTTALLLTAATTPARADDFDVAIENSQPGTPGWQLPAKRFTRDTEAYLSRASALAGEQIDLYARCKADTFTVVALRVGYYQEIGRAHV